MVATNGNNKTANQPTNNEMGDKPNEINGNTHTGVHID